MYTDPGFVHMSLQTPSPLVQVMACHLFGAKPLSEPRITYYNQKFLFTKMPLEMLPRNVTHFYSYLNVLTFKMSSRQTNLHPELLFYMIIQIHTFSCYYYRTKMELILHT